MGGETAAISDQDLRQRLEACGLDPGPLTEFSRPYWMRKLMEAERRNRFRSHGQRHSGPTHPVRAGLRFPDEEDEAAASKSEDTVPGSDDSDASDDEGSESIAKRREEEIQQRKAAVKKVQSAGARVLDDVRKSHIKDRHSPFLLRYSHHLLVGMVLAVAGVLLVNALNYSMTRNTPDARDNFVWCTAGQFCRPETQKKLEKALKLVYKIADVADELAGSVKCGTGSQDSVSATTLREVAGSLWPTSSEFQPVLRDALKLLAFNPHWKIAVLSSNIITLEPRDIMPDAELDNAHVVSTNPMKPFKCRLMKGVHGAATQALLLSVLAFLLVLLFIAVRFYVRHQDREQQQVFKMVDKILSHVSGVHQSSLKGDVPSPAVPISHVRDVLLPPADRRSKSHVWESAVSWINRRESRIRTETRRISGEDFVVWRWIPISSYAEARTDGAGEDETDGKSAVSSPATSPSSAAAAEKLEDREKQWGGHVLEHYSREEFRKQVVPLAATPACCVKLRNLYAVQPRPSTSELEELEAAVLHKLTQYGGVLHCFLDKWTDEGALYAKLNSVEAATSVIAALHGTWYNNRLVKAEYTPLAEYHRLFPSSTHASKLLFPP